jgi:tetratricopeptide (TPR) repeat protein
MIRHLHVVGAREADRLRLVGSGPAGPRVIARCHRELRGPYTGVDTVVDTVIADARRRCPDLVAFHQPEIVTVLQHLEPVLGPAPQSLSDTASFEERTRWYGPMMIRVLSQSVVTFLREYARQVRADGDTLPTLVFDGGQDADITTQEFLALFVRRVDAELWPVVIGSTATLPAELAAALDAHADRADAPATDSAAPALDLDDAALARCYVDSDGATDDPAVLAGYLRVPAADRAALHDRRAEDLETDAGWGLRCGALAFHREHGSDPTGAGVDALMRAAEYCTRGGFTDRMSELAERCRALIDAEADEESYRKITMMLIAHRIGVKRLDDVVALCEDLRRRYSSALVHLNTSYVMAMVYTRFVVPRDHERAMAWQNNAIAVARGLDDPRQRLVLSGFEDNGMALIQMHRGNLVGALELVDNAMARLDDELADEDWALHRSQLLYNRTRLLAGLKRYDEAYAGFSTLIDIDPHYTDYLTERASCPGPAATARRPWPTTTGPTCWGRRSPSCCTTGAPCTSSSATTGRRWPTSTSCWTWSRIRPRPGSAGPSCCWRPVRSRPPPWMWPGAWNCCPRTPGCCACAG